MSLLEKIFNTSAVCIPEFHYMVDLSSRLQKMKQMIDAGQYFVINRARQYGKTTLLRALKKSLEPQYIVISLDFQMLSSADFSNEFTFTSAFSREVLDSMENIREMPSKIQQELFSFSTGQFSNATLSLMFRCLTNWCKQSEKKIVLMIDEVDNASNNQVFLDFLAQLRGYYMKRDTRPTFQSVILAGVYDIKNLKLRIRSNQEHRYNSPWNIAADFNIDMNFSANDIASMLLEYETDHHTHMNIPKMAELIYDYTSGYPVLVSSLCKLISEKVAAMDAYKSLSDAWTKSGFLEALKLLLNDQMPLFESLTNKLLDQSDLRKMISDLLFSGKIISYSPDNRTFDTAQMFGFVKVQDGQLVIANRIFEIRLYNMLLTTPSMLENDIYKYSIQNKSQFITNGHLNMTYVLEKFVTHFNDVYGEQNRTFYEEDGRRYFLLYLRPIINGVGNYYVEARTRNFERTDIIVDYAGEQFIIEMKIWRGEKYNRKGEQQLAEYLDSYHLKKGYLLSFNFNKNKTIGLKEIQYDDKIIIEAVV